jgi:hypothetical protein
MSDRHIPALVETVGLDETARRLLIEKTIGRAHEEFFTEYLEHLSWRVLFTWLTREPPEDAAERPYGRIITRIVETITATDGVRFFFHPSVIREIRAVHAREELIEQLRPKIDKNVWLRNLAFASTSVSEVFKAVRDVELSVWDEPALVPRIALVEGSVPILSPRLFSDRRHEETCLRTLREAAHDEKTRSYALWLLDKTDLLPRMGPVADLLGVVPALSEVEPLDRDGVLQLVGLAERWLDGEHRRQWAVGRYLRAAEHGTPWTRLWWEIEPEFRDDVALASLAMSRPAPWALYAIGRRMQGSDAWKQTFAFLDRIGEPRDEQAPWGALARGAADLGREVSLDERTEALHQFEPWHIGEFLRDAPLPQEVDDAFDERLLRLFGGWPHRLTVVQRLQDLPLTRSRANRILAITQEGDLFWTLEKAAEIAKAACPATVDVPMPTDLSARNVALFKTLVGPEAAILLLGAKFDELIKDGGWHGLYTALHLAEVEPAIVSENRRDALRTLALRQPVALLAQVQHAAPWLLTEAELLASAMEEGRDWGLSSMWEKDLPPALAPVMEARAVTEPVAEAAPPFLDHLERFFGRGRRDVLALAVERIKKMGPSSVPPSWLAAKLDTRSLWQEPGEKIISLLLAPCDQQAAHRVSTVCVQAATHRDDVRLAPAIHTVLGSVFIDIAERALRERNETLARNALTGLACLFSASRLRPRLGRLRHLPGHEAVLSVIEVNENLLRRADSAANAGSVLDVLKALEALLGPEKDDDNPRQGSVS